MAKQIPIVAADVVRRQGPHAQPLAAPVETTNAARGPEIEIISDIEQGDDRWFEVRRGIPTASEFHKILAGGEGKTRENYLNQLAGEYLSERIAETYRNASMDRGNEIEPVLREKYLASRFCQVTCVGFVRRRLPSGRWVGGSPDALVDGDGVLEIKSHKPEILIPILEGRATAGLASFRAQCQGLLWITGRAWCDIRLGYWGHPTYAARFDRDEHYIKQLSDAVEVFDYDLHQKVEKLRRMA